MEIGAVELWKAHVQACQEQTLDNIRNEDATFILSRLHQHSKARIDLSAVVSTAAGSTDWIRRNAVASGRDVGGSSVKAQVLDEEQRR